MTEREREHYGSGVDPTANLPLTIPPEVRQQIRESLGLGQPFHIRYLYWLQQFFVNEPLNILERHAFFRIGAAHSAFDEAVGEHQADHAVTFCESADHVVRQMPVGVNDCPGVAVTGEQRTSPQVQSLPEAFFSQVTHVQRDPAFARAWDSALQRARDRDVKAFYAAMPEKLLRTVSELSTMCKAGERPRSRDSRPSCAW